MYSTISCPEWGPWQLLPATDEVYDPRHHFAVDLELMSDNNRVLDGLLQVSMKSWSLNEPREIDGLLRAINDVLHPEDREPGQSFDVSEIKSRIAAFVHEVEVAVTRRRLTPSGNGKHSSNGGPAIAVYALADAHRDAGWVVT